MQKPCRALLLSQLIAVIATHYNASARYEVAERKMQMQTRRAMEPVTWAAGVSEWRSAEHLSP